MNVCSNPLGHIYISIYMYVCRLQLAMKPRTCSPLKHGCCMFIRPFILVRKLQVLRVAEKVYSSLSVYLSSPANSPRYVERVLLFIHVSSLSSFPLLASVVCPTRPILHYD